MARRKGLSLDKPKKTTKAKVIKKTVKKEEIEEAQPTITATTKVRAANDDYMKKFKYRRVRFPPENSSIETDNDAMFKIMAADVMTKYNIDVMKLVEKDNARKAEVAKEASLITEDKSIDSTNVSEPNNVMPDQV